MTRQWAVMDDLGHILWHYHSQEEAEGYRDWLLRRNEEIRVQAEKQKKALDAWRDGDKVVFPPTNEQYVQWWHQSRLTGGADDGGLVARTYHIVSRLVGPWEDV